MNLDRVFNGIIKYLDREIFPHMNDWQDMIARIYVSRVMGDPEKLKQTVMGNPFLRTFAIMDGEGNVDIDHLLNDIRAQIEKKGKLELNIPMFGKFNFMPNDVDKLRYYIMEG